MTNKSLKESKPLPKRPSLNFGGGMPSMFSRGGFVAKNTNQGKFNQATFHTQHKGGSAGSGGK